MVKNSPAGPFGKRSATEEAGAILAVPAHCLAAGSTPRQDTRKSRQQSTTHVGLPAGIDDDWGPTFSACIMIRHLDWSCMRMSHGGPSSSGCQLALLGVGDALGRPVTGSRSRYGAGIDRSVINDARCMSYASHGDQGLLLHVP